MSIQPPPDPNNHGAIFGGEARESDGNRQPLIAAIGRTIGNIALYIDGALAN